MRTFLLGLVAGVVLVFVLAGLAAGVALFIGQGDSGLPSEFALVVRLDGSVPEHVEAELPQFLTGRSGPDLTLYSLVQSIRRAVDDESVKALVLECGWSASGWAKAQEVRWAVEEFKASGKPVWAYLTVPSREGYYIGSLADHVVIQPESYLNLSGLRAEVMFFKGTLDKLGVEVDLIRSGRYKSAGEPFTREEMSPEFRAILEETLEEFYTQLLEGIASGRGENADHWRAVLDEGPFTAKEAQTHRLADAELHKDTFYDLLSEAVEVEDLPKVGANRYGGQANRATGRGRKTIAILHAIGTITSGTSQSDPFGVQPTTLGADSFRSQLTQLREDEDIDGVILRIDSPGGDAIASEQMLHDVRRLAEEKPLVVSMSNVAASGGYYIASVPDASIVAYPGTYTGSIGVFTIRYNLRKLYEKLGISKDVLTKGRFAGIDSDYKSMTAEERAKLATYVDSIYQVFLQRVSEGRGVDTGSVRELAEGRVWIGTQAAENGLVDELGGYAKAIELVKEAAEIGEDEAVRIVSYPLKRSPLEALFSRGRNVAVDGLLQAPGVGEVYSAWSQIVAHAGRLRSGPMYIAPYTLTVH